MTKKLNSRVTLTNDLQVDPSFHEKKVRVVIDKVGNFGFNLNIYADFLPDGAVNIPIEDDQRVYEEVNRLVNETVGNKRKYFLDIQYLTDFSDICPDFYETGETDPEIEAKKESIEISRLDKTDETLEQKRESWMY